MTTMTDETVSSLSHEELIAITSSVLNDLLCKDAYLNDLPTDATLDEINNHLAVMHGNSITVDLTRGDDEILPITVPQKGSRVTDLKRAIKRSINLEQERQYAGARRRNISWKYVWKTYNLEFDNNIMDDDNKLLSQYGIVHRSVIKFKKKLRQKRKMIHY